MSPPMSQSLYDFDEASRGSEVPLHVLDLPQLHTQPSASALLAALSLLQVQPLSWSPTRRGAKQRRPAVSPEGLASYLTRIVASPLSWISGDEKREEVWEAASVRLAERSGRNAMPSMERAFHILRRPGATDDVPGEDLEVEIRMHEPSLTGDNLGLKTWAASYLLAKRLRDICFPSLADRLQPRASYEVLELGSGTGLVGMAAAAVLGIGVVLTDLPEIETNLARNVADNRPAISRHGGRAITAVLDWTKPSSLTPSSPLHKLSAASSSVALLDPKRGLETALPTPPDSNPSTPAQLPSSFPIILAADCIYDPQHASLLANTISTWLSKRTNARVVIELPLRTAYAADVEELRRRMTMIGLDLLEEGEESGVDDWGADDDEGQEVRCWWSVWGWKDQPRPL